MRIWRALRAAGGELLRDGVYILPYSSTTQLDALKRGLAELPELDARRRIAAVARDGAALHAVDFFPGKSSKQLQQQLNDAQSALNAKYSPNEPQAVHRKIARRDIKDFQGRTWATRERMWIDRVCSAWLIRRFIDRQARFVWFKNIKNLPKRALGFDFDGAEFSHVDSKVTFEVLLTSFGLDSDVALGHLGSLVHFLDMGGIPIAEAAGLAAIVSGTRTLHANDDALLKYVTPVLDSLYQSYATSEKPESARSGSEASPRVTKAARPNRP